MVIKRKVINMDKLSIVINKDPKILRALLKPDIKNQDHDSCEQMQLSSSFLCRKGDVRPTRS